MRGQLSRETRLEISVTRLKNGIKKVREENVVLKLKIKERDKKIWPKRFTPPLPF